MDYEKLAEILRFSTPKSLWVVTFNNILKELFCPFDVIVINTIDVLVKGQIVSVDEIKVTEELKTVYVINNKAYYYYHFDILID